MDERLKQYLKECRQKKLAWEQVEHVLEGSNYPPEIVAEAKVWYETPTEIMVPSDPVKTIAEVKPKRKLVWAGILVLILVIVASGFSWGVLYMVGTQRLTLPNKNLQSQAEKLALAVPGVPVNPKVVMTLVSEAHKKVSKSSFEISLSGQLQASEIESLLGSESLDMQIKGYSDVSDTLNPRFSMNMIFGKEIDVDIRKPDNMIYVKVNKLPVALYALLGMDPLRIKPLWDNWIGTDTSKLDTPARQKLDESLGSQNIVEKLMNNEILSSAKIVEDNRNGSKVYKITYQVTKEQFIDLGREIWKPGTSMTTNPYEMVRSVNVEMWVDKKSMLVSEMNIAMTIEKDGNKSDVVIVIKMSDFGKDVLITRPDKYLSPEEFLSEFMKLEPGGIYGALLRATPSASLGQ